MTRYDRIGATYTATRRADPRIDAAIRDALGDASSVVNVGAGAGSYEPADREVIAVEPSATMIGKRPPGAARALQGVAEALPLENDSVDAAMAIWTIHHWSDARAGLAELRRVARQRVVILTWDTAFAGTFWLTRDYVPELDAWSVDAYPALDAIEEALGPLERRPVPIPSDCEDGFLRAWWSRPEAYLDEGVRRNISQFNLVDPSAVTRGIGRLARDLADGTWDERNGHLRELERLHLGYVLFVSLR